MSRYHYSATTTAFYLTALRASYEAAGNWPDDAVETTDDAFETFGAGNAPDGMRRGADQEGRPAWVPIPPPTAEQILFANTRERDKRLQEATARLAPLQDAADLGDARPDEQEALTAWKRYRVDLSRTDLTQYPAAWPDSPDTANP